jgi:hypothetical protein
MGSSLQFLRFPVYKYDTRLALQCWIQYNTIRYNTIQYIVQLETALHSSSSDEAL